MGRGRGNMRYKDVEWQLYNYNGIQLRIARLQRDIESLAEGIISLGGSGDGMPRSSEISNPTEKNAIRLTEIKAEKELQLNRDINIIKNLDEAMSALSKEQQAILKARYLDHNPWVQVANETGYSVSQAKELRKRAIDRLVEILS